MAAGSATLEQYSHNTGNIQVLKANEAQTLWNDLDAFYCRAEKELLNPLGYIPVVGTAIGAARIAMAFFQGAVAYVGVFFENLAGVFSSERANSIRHYDGAGACQEHSIHAILNGVRGSIEMVPLLPLITLTFYDAAGSCYRYRSQLQNCSIVPIKEKIDVLQQAR